MFGLLKGAINAVFAIFAVIAVLSFLDVFGPEVEMSDAMKEHFVVHSQINPDFCGQRSVKAENK